MISMFKLHFYYLFSWKVFYISFIILVICLVCFLFFSNFYLNYDLLLFNKNYYLEDYYFESINFIKIIIIMFNLFLIINGFIVNNYDVVLLTRRSKKDVIISKVLSISVISIIFTVLLYQSFLVTGLFLTPYMNIGLIDFSICADLVVFGLIYLHLYILAYTLSKGIYSLLVVIIGYFVSDITIEYYILKDSVTTFSKVINVVFVNVSYYSDSGYGLLYSKTSGIIVIAMLFLVIIYSYLKNDIIN